MGLLLTDFFIYTNLGMVDKEETKERKRMVVEEVGDVASQKVEEPEKEAVNEPVKPEILEEAAKDTVSDESKPETEKVEENKKPEAANECRNIEPRKSPSIALWIIIPGIFLLGAILGGIVFYQRGVKSIQEGTPSPIATSISVPTASTSPSPLVDPEKFTISIFNGSGISGEAGKAKALLTAAGFRVGTTANAATYDYTKTIIKAKSTVDTAYVDALSAALAKTYVVDTVQTLASTSADTIQIVIGSSKAP